MSGSRKGVINDLSHRVASAVRGCARVPAQTCPQCLAVAAKSLVPAKRYMSASRAPCGYPAVNSNSLEARGVCRVRSRSLLDGVGLGAAIGP
jgi:hypothetical protein